MKQFILFIFLVGTTLGAVIQSDPNYDQQQQTKNQKPNENVNGIELTDKEEEENGVDDKSNRLSSSDVIENWQQERIMDFSAGASLGKFKVGASFKLTDPYAGSRRESRRRRRHRYDDDDGHYNENDDYYRLQQLQRENHRSSSSSSSRSSYSDGSRHRQGKRRPTIIGITPDDMKYGIVLHPPSTMSGIHDHHDDDIVESRFEDRTLPDHTHETPGSPKHTDSEKPLYGRSEENVGTDEQPPSQRPRYRHRDYRPKTD